MDVNLNHMRAQLTSCLNRLYQRMDHYALPNLDEHEEELITEAFDDIAMYVAILNTVSSPYEKHFDDMTDVLEVRCFHKEDEQ